MRYEQNVCCASVREPFGHHLMAHKQDRNAKKRACHQLQTTQAGCKNGVPAPPAGAGDETAHPNDDHQATLTRHHTHCHRDLLQTPPPSNAIYCKRRANLAPLPRTLLLRRAGERDLLPPHRRGRRDGGRQHTRATAGDGLKVLAACSPTCSLYAAMPTSARAAPPPRARARPLLPPHRRGRRDEGRQHTRATAGDGFKMLAACSPTCSLYAAMPTSVRAAPPPRARARPHAGARACKTSKLTRRLARAPSTLVQAHDLRHTRLHARTRKFTPHMRGQHH